MRRYAWTVMFTVTMNMKRPVRLPRDRSKFVARAANRRTNVHRTSGPVRAKKEIP